jgi:hypothetical protein
MSASSDGAPSANRTDALADCEGSAEDEELDPPQPLTAKTIIAAKMLKLQRSIMQKIPKKKELRAPHHRGARNSTESSLL